MTRTAIPTAGTTQLGVDIPQREAADPVGGNSIANPDGCTVLLIGNVGTVNRTLAVRISATVDGQPVNPRVYTVAAGRRLILGCYPWQWYGTTLDLDPEHADLRISALRFGDSIPVTVPAGPWSMSGSVVVLANLAAAGFTTAGDVLIVDSDLTGATVDGGVLVVDT